jgi:hypothetical protein
MPSSSTTFPPSSFSSHPDHHFNGNHDAHTHYDGYFAYQPLAYSSHFSEETPLSSPGFTASNDSTLSDPCNPLLAQRLTQSPSLSTSPRMAANVLQLQTGAAYSSSGSGSASSRPAVRPTQNLLGLDNSSDGSDTSIVDGRTSSEEYARCSRCQRTPSVDVRTGQWNMISYGLNLWYCNRCAALVGLPKR